MPNPPTQPQHAAAHASAAGQLERYFLHGEDLLKSDVRSPQSSFETTMGQLEKSRRHRMKSYRVKSADGRLRVVNMQGSDILCGCEVHPTGDAGGGSYELDAESIEAMGQTVAYFRRIERGIAEARWSEKFEAAPATSVAHVLRLRYRERLTPERAMFDARAAPRLRTTIAAQGSRNAITRERVRLMADVLRGQIERGPGSIAHLTQAAWQAFGAVRTQRTVAGWIDNLGRKLMQPRVSVEDRDLCRAITLEAEEVLEVEAVAAYRRALGGHVPEAVRRAADARAG